MASTADGRRGRLSGLSAGRSLLLVGTFAGGPEPQGSVNARIAALRSGLRFAPPDSGPHERRHGHGHDHDAEDEKRAAD